MNILKRFHRKVSSAELLKCKTTDEVINKILNFAISDNFEEEEKLLFGLIGKYMSIGYILKEVHRYDNEIKAIETKLSNSGILTLEDC